MRLCPLALVTPVRETDACHAVRVENEHLGNVDQYRVTREVPLPYSIDDVGHDSEGYEDMDEDAVSKRSWRGRRRGLSAAQAPSPKGSSDNERA